MGCTIDHLQSDHRVRVLRDFSDARGAQHRAGETAVIRHMDLDWTRQEIGIEWERDGTKEKLCFLLATKDGPRNGHMRDYFAMEERVPLPEDTPAGRTARRRQQASAELAKLRALPIPALVAAPVSDPARYADAVIRVTALVAHRRFAEAEEQIGLILAEPDPYGGKLEQLAGEMVGIAERHALEKDETIYAWARQRAIGLWYSWGSQATSGGEGAVRAPYIRTAEERLAQCDALHL